MTDSDRETKRAEREQRWRKRWDHCPEVEKIIILDRFATAFEILGSIARWHGSISPRDMFMPVAAIVALLVIDVPQSWSANHTIVLRWAMPLRAAAYLLAVAALLLLKGQGDATFIYFQF